MTKSKDMIPEKDKEKALSLALDMIEKQFGKGSIMKFSETANSAGVEVLPTGSLSLDLALGAGGIPRGRITEIFGPEGSGKTTVAQHVIALTQKKGGTAAFIDVEHALDPIYAAKIGIVLENLLISQPSTGEEALEITETLVRSGAVDVIVIDSVAALVPKAEIEGDMGDSHVGLQARLMSQALRKLTASISRTNTAVIFINQLREKVGVVYGSPEVTPGGRALKFYSSVRIDLRRADHIKQGTNIIGNRVKAKIVKNKIAPPFKLAEFDIMYNGGISREGDVLDLAVATAVINKSGSFFSYGDVRLGQGRENAKIFLQQNEALLDEIEKKVRECAAVGLTGTPGKGKALEDFAEQVNSADDDQDIEF